MVYLTVSKGYEPGGLRHEPVTFDNQGNPSLSTYIVKKRLYNMSLVGKAPLWKEEVIFQRLHL